MQFVGDFPLILKRHPRARHLKLRYDAKKNEAHLTLPKGVSDLKAVEFAEKHHDWLLKQSEKSPDSIPFAPDEEIPYRGRFVKIIHQPDRTAKVFSEGGNLVVGGPIHGFEIRLQNWMKKQARLAFETAVAGFAPKLGIKPNRISVRDTKSRWGSCSSGKTLSFSWRLIMAPTEILGYVVAHEMAHLIEMNHGPKFWALVEKLDEDWRDSRHWLKKKAISFY